MKLLKISAFALTIALSACNNNKSEPAQTATPKTSDVVIGNYASSDYEKRKEGYDWVGVMVTKNNDSTVHISIRSRADIKKPTCTFDADAKRLNDSVYKANVMGKDILFNFNPSQMSIATARKEDEGILNYFCSGGGSLAGIFNKTTAPLDSIQIDKAKLK
ncbi:hypothetical protein [Pedobacter sp. Hv1]|uniref:hypothetical protein n=1 Tax=Pedobacter sp. Hv1 TaxID=1740090 RepID=UPI0006D8C34A|nr:hypothetical protein [Pedobacter sp. Hv1]KQC01843.1 hypothetical protein AQF98_05625 [Pedobacter sp. Hv1]